MNYQSNLEKFQRQLDKEVAKLFKMYDDNATQFDIEEQTEIMDGLTQIVEGLKTLVKMEN